MEKYLVTGGAGFIGSHIVETLINQGHQVRVLDNLATGKQENIDLFEGKIEFINGDIRDENICRLACQDVDYVIHQAALGSVPRSIEQPQLFNDVDITGTLNLLVAARDTKAKRFVFASSSSVYGDTPVLPKVESMPPNPLSPYALAKFTAESYCILFYQLYGLETVSLRYFNIFGPRQDPESQYAAVFPSFVTKLLAGESPSFYGDGEQKRDFTYVANAVEANLKACKAPSNACGKTYNVACNEMISIKELFYSMREIIGRDKPDVLKIEPKYEAARAGDIKESLADINLAKKYLSYDPQVSYAQGIGKTVEYFIKVCS